MALISILPGKFLGGRKGVEISGFPLDATVQEVHTLEADVTENAVEEGAPVNDHMDIKARQIVIEGIVSDTPLNFGATLQGAGTIAGQVIGKKIGATLGQQVGAVAGGALVGLLLNRSGSPTKNAYDHFKRLQEARVTFDVVSGIQVYTNMVLTSLTITRDTSTGKSLRFSATCKQVRIVRNKEVEVPNSVASVNAATKAELGKKAQAAVTQDNRTLAKTGFDKIAGLFGKAN
jgi:hypothetical protein